MNPPPPRKLLEVVRETIRLKHYSYRTEQTYVDWIKRYLVFHQKKHPCEMGGEEIRAFLTHLAVDKNVAAATQNQALNAILFLYREVLKIELENIGAYLRAKRSKRLPIVLTKEVKMADDFSDRSPLCDRCSGHSQPTKVRIAHPRN
ncbi:Genome sequencing data, contig C304 [Microcystis aeruginosa PCC 9807]|uniref:Genome sequencing data, contig C304 n=1 Tax=Microcystis aeruginosa PCC 9807 TaxID=1160283 RepID=I4H9K7_MICAE|nr:phage integrase N-terminal SAM-like domain-containing protein [Microcystis aeruginosa]CCI18731.1 Genome sequencing data, contig C304 [Microcystis aeruginosa PCC 9807]